MRITIAGCDFEILGDPHRGRPFRNGVPLHRLGDREDMQAEEMQASLARTDNIVAHVCMGDLFDKPKVDNKVVLQVAREYRHAARRTVDKVMDSQLVDWVVLTGNHDESRDTGIVSSFQLFTEIVQEEIYVVRKIPLLRVYENKCRVVFIPWHPLITAREMVEQHAELIRDADAVFGHWDVDRRLEGTDNYIPADLFVELGVPLAITGHDHVARELELSGLKVIVTGSMQPYSHSEDPDSLYYITVLASSAAEALARDPEVFRDMCVRVVGEWDDAIPNCLQFKVVADASEEDAAEVLANVQIAEFSMADLWQQALGGVDPEINAELKARFAEIGGETE